MLPRIARLRARLFAGDDRSVFLERRLGLRRGYERHHDQPAEILHARILAEILDGMTVVLDPDELIVGRPHEVVPTLAERDLLDLPPHLRSPPFFSTGGHLTLAWPILLQRGLRGVQATALAGLAALDSAHEAARDARGADDPESARRRRFWQAAVICCDAVVRLAERYAETAERLALDAEPARGQELHAIAAVLRQVPAGPARTFHEAVQSVWFLDFIFHTVCGARDYALGRLDQYLYPYYAADRAVGRLSRERARELLACLFLKTNEIIGLGDQQTPTKRELHQDSVQYLVVGGQTADGQDATNDLSFLCLEAADELRLKQPTLTVRYHAGLDRGFWRAVLDAIRRGVNGVGIYNDAVTIPALVRCGVAPADAWDITFYGCCHPSVPGHECQLREHQHNLAKHLELALNDGCDLLTGEPTGPRTGDPSSLATFDDLLRALRRQVEAGVERAAVECDELWRRRLAETPFQVESLLVEGCVETATTVGQGARYVHYIHHGGAIATVADSLAAIRGAVYEESLLSLAELRDVLAADFAGQERLRLRLRSRYPRFGNDDEAADDLARLVGGWFCDAVLQHRSGPSGAFWPQLYSYHRYKRMGRLTGATADGRRQGEPVSENHSPTLGADRLGPTALLSSLARLPFDRTPAGGVTLTLHPTAYAGEAGLAALGDLLETYFRQGGLHLQVTVVDRETLLAARARPDEHRGLVVRVTGYSAYFVTLDPASQEQVIARAT